MTFVFTFHKILPNFSYFDPLDDQQKTVKFSFGSDPLSCEKSRGAGASPVPGSMAASSFAWSRCGGAGLAGIHVGARVCSRAKGSNPQGKAKCHLAGFCGVAREMRYCFCPLDRARAEELPLASCPPPPLVPTLFPPPTPHFRCG